MRRNSVINAVKYADSDLCECGHRYDGHWESGDFSQPHGCSAENGTYGLGVVRWCSCREFRPKKRKEVAVKKLTDIQEGILYFLRKNAAQGPISPTKIGMTVGGKEYATASSWGSARVKPLVAAGLVVRNAKGHYSLAEKS